VLDENAGFVELLMEAFKVLLRDPKNVAIIVLCVFLVVMMKRPGVETGIEVGAAVRYQAAAEVPVVQVPVPVVDRAKLEAPVVVEPVVAVPGVVEVEVEVSAMEAGAEMGADPTGLVASLEARGQEQEQEVEVEVVPVVHAEEEVVTDTPALDVETAVGLEVLGFSPVVDFLAVWALEYPMSSLDAEPMVESETAEPEEAIVEVSAESLTEAERDMAPEDEVLGEEFSTPDPTPESDEAAATEREILSETEGCAAPVADSSDSEPGQVVPEPEEEATYLCGSQAQPKPAPSAHSHHPACDISTDNEDSDDEAELPTPSSVSASTTSVFIPGPLVTERKTVRVFETITQIVRVSVVTQTETVSTVVTAVPQTVEETVYETETVRVTVSVPVEERAAKKSKGRAVCGGSL
jgi:hypothetical protein